MYGFPVTIAAMECQALCRSVPGAKHFSHYNKGDDYREAEMEAVMLRMIMMIVTSGMITRVGAAASPPAPTMTATAATHTAETMMTWRRGTVSSVTA